MSALLPLKNKKIILGITGSIAAYKACVLCRLLIKNGADVQVVMTPSACKLVGRDTLAALSGHPVPCDIFEDAGKIGHIAISKDADIAVVAPATAQTIAKLAHGFADNMLTAGLLAATCPIAIAPAMNVNMFRNQATQENLRILSRRGYYVMRPASGSLACGDTGEGRMPEPEDIMGFILSILNGSHAQRIGFEGREALPSPKSPAELGQTRLLPRASGAGLKVIVTAGPTAEAIDPVRFITNRSSGRMGYAIAKAARERGASVVLISGPTALEAPEGVTRINVRSALDMLQAVEDNLAGCSVFIGCAAVSDYRCENIADQKISGREKGQTMTLKLVKNPDIAATVGKLEHGRPFTVGFAAETINGEEHAKAKLEEKNLDMIAMNYVNSTTQGFGSGSNELFVYDRDGLAAHLPLQSKQALAGELCDMIFTKAAGVEKA